MFEPVCFFKAGINPYDTNKASVVFPPPENFTNDIHPNDIVVWDSHFGYNEGHTKLNTLMQDKTLKLLAVFYPEETFKTLGDITYEVYVFRKTSRDENFDNEMILKNLNENYYQKTAIFSNNFTDSKTRSSDSLHGGCLRVTKDMEFSPGMETNLGKLNFHEKKKIEVSVDVFPDKSNTHSRIDIVSSVNDELKVLDYHRYVINFDQLESGKWNTVRFEYFLPVISDKNSVFKVYLWNTNNTEVLIDNLNVCVLERN